MLGNIVSNIQNAFNTAQNVLDQIQGTVQGAISALNNIGGPLSDYTTGPRAESWRNGIMPREKGTDSAYEGVGLSIQKGGNSSSPKDGVVYKPIFQGGRISSGPRELTAEEKAITGNPKGLTMDGSIEVLEQKMFVEDPDAKMEVLNSNIDDIQNVHKFPTQLEAANEEQFIPAKYDYSIQVGDTRYPIVSKLEDELMKVRASFGLPVHGQPDIAKAMKYYAYNRFKTPDVNMAHNKTVTYVFFTRPDLNLLEFNGQANSQTLNHTETAILWRRNPEIFKLLTDYTRCKDQNNFNLLLSNQVTSFDMQDETLSVIEAGKSWQGYEMIYGDMYSGRAAGQFGCNFVDTQDYSVIQLIKLWITYIDMVAKGAWSPSYNLRARGGVGKTLYDSHVYTKTLDYASSCYVFKCGPDGEDILYWSKYFGIFPINTGAQALSWDLTTPIGDNPKINISFRYSFKRDMSPISLIEFNSVANVLSAVSEPGYDPELNQSGRPFVGSPFIQMNLPDPRALSSSGGVNMGESYSRASVRLKFRPIEDTNLTDEKVYRSNLANRGISPSVSHRATMGLRA